ncbi:alanine:cation symporter family protein [Parabacteroides distasonis]|uniref:alanine:cation symporter family protein n=1 Tax=Parabacteroides distasonis TaxID=823 RepID=UPI002877F645|nr:alanine:cation symporter family protein [Parabacteroides distasonis]
MGNEIFRVYHIIYIVGFFLTSFTDTTIAWTLFGITMALMTFPNLIGILLLHNEVKSSMNEYWRRMKEKL